MKHLSTLLAQNKTSLGDFQGIGGYFTDPSKGAIDPLGQADHISNLISNVIGFLTITAGLAFIIYFAIGGLTWITSGGDKGKVEDAKNRMTGAAIGMIIIVVSWAIAWIVGKALGVDFLDFETNILNLKP